MKQAHWFPSSVATAAFVALCLASMYGTLSNVSLLNKLETPHDRTGHSQDDQQPRDSTKTKIREHTRTVTDGADAAAPRRFVAPDETNTVVAMIAMGKASQTFLVERAVRSLRMSGGFAGWVAVLTDSDGQRRYNETLVPWDAKTILLPGLEEDRDWGRGTKVTGVMVIKRFKTLLFKYLDLDERVSGESSRHVLYLDIDIVCKEDLAPFLGDYHTLVTAEYDRQLATGRARNASFGLSFVSAYDDPGAFAGKGYVHSGLMVFDRHFAAQCLDHWRYMFDKVPAVMDQQLLKYAVQDPERCVPFMLDGMNKSHYSLYNPGKLMKGAQPTFVHITSGRANRNTSHQIELLRNVLKLKDPQTEILFGNTTWNEAIQPTGLYGGKKPKRKE